MQAPQRSFLASVTIFLINLYRNILAQNMLHSCKFFPSCSEYAIIAIEHYGVFRGAWMVTKRLLRCQPFAKGGFDPVVWG